VYGRGKEDRDGMNKRLVRGERRKTNKKKDEDASHNSQTTSNQTTQTTQTTQTDALTRDTKQCK